MRRMIHFCIVLLLLVLIGRLVWAQDSTDVITVTGLYVSFAPGGEYEEILMPCDSSEVWDVVPHGAAFTALAQAYASAETGGQLSKYRELFVEVRGRYSAYEGESHSDGLFEITEFVRHSTAAADITACGSECEDIYGANSATCLAQVDGQCGSSRDSCAAGIHMDSDIGSEEDTETQYRWTCAGLYGGDNSEVCTAPLNLLALGAVGYCADHGPCSAGQGDCDSDSECQSGLTCVDDVGATYGFGANIDVCEASIVPPVVTEQVQSIYRRATTTPAAPSGETSTENHVPSGWSTSQPTPTTTEGVYESQRTVTYQSGVFQSATAWGTPTLVAQTQSIYRLASTTPATPSGGTSTENHVPSGWSTSQPTPTTTEGVYESQRTVTYQSGVFQSATAWGTPARVTAPAVSVGHADYCRDHGPCSAGQGDCDSDSECQSGSTCVHDVGANYGWDSIIDVCEATVNPGDNDYCRDHGPCSAGQGDCDSDSECQSGSTCVDDVGANYGWRSIVDVCEDPGSLGGNDYCRDHGPCSAGQGDCDSDSECQSGLTCVDDVGANYGWRAIVDVCEATVNPGDNDYCRDHGPCSAGQGDCDSDSECQSGLTCVDDVGANYGWRAIVDVCEATVNPGDNDYCRDHGPCSAGQGDCDSDSECQSGLTCVDDVGANYGWRAIVDVCEDPGSLGGNDYCRDHGPCSAGQGDCDSNSECQSGLTCVNDVGANYGWRAIVDVCEATVNPGDNDYCRDHGPCSAGQGDCDSNSECQSGLTCVNDVGANYGWRAIVDVCEATVNPGDNDYCRDHGPCSAGQGDCDSNSECQSGLTCVNDVGANYGWRSIVDVCEASS